MKQRIFLSIITFLLLFFSISITNSASDDVTSFASNTVWPYSSMVECSTVREENNNKDWSYSEYDRSECYQFEGSFQYNVCKKGEQCIAASSIAEKTQSTNWVNPYKDKTFESNWKEYTFWMLKEKVSAIIAKIGKGKSDSERVIALESFIKNINETKNKEEYKTNSLVQNLVGYIVFEVQTEIDTLKEKINSTQQTSWVNKFLCDISWGCEKTEDTSTWETSTEETSTEETSTEETSTWEYDHLESYPADTTDSELTCRWIKSIWEGVLLWPDVYDITEYDPLRWIYMDTKNLSRKLDQIYKGQSTAWLKKQIWCKWTCKEWYEPNGPWCIKIWTTDHILEWKDWKNQYNELFKLWEKTFNFDEIQNILWIDGGLWLWFILFNVPRYGANIKYVPKTGIRQVNWAENFCRRLWYNSVKVLKMGPLSIDKKVHLYSEWWQSVDSTEVKEYRKPDWAPSCKWIDSEGEEQGNYECISEVTCQTTKEAEPCYASRVDLMATMFLDKIWNFKSLTLKHWDSYSSNEWYHTFSDDPKYKFRYPADRATLAFHSRWYFRQDTTAKYDSNINYVKVAPVMYDKVCNNGVWVFPWYWIEDISNDKWVFWAQWDYTVQSTDYDDINKLHFKMVVWYNDPKINWKYLRKTNANAHLFCRSKWYDQAVKKQYWWPWYVWWYFYSYFWKSDNGSVSPLPKVEDMAHLRTYWWNLYTLPFESIKKEYINNQRAAPTRKLNNWDKTWWGSSYMVNPTEQQEVNFYNLMDTIFYKKGLNVSNQHEGWTYIWKVFCGNADIPPTRNVFERIPSEFPLCYRWEVDIPNAKLWECWWTRVVYEFDLEKIEWAELVKKDIFTSDWVGFENLTNRFDKIHWIFSFKMWTYRHFTRSLTYGSNAYPGHVLKCVPWYTKIYYPSWIKFPYIIGEAKEYNQETAHACLKSTVFEESYKKAAIKEWEKHYKKWVRIFNLSLLENSLKRKVTLNTFKPIVFNINTNTTPNTANLKSYSVFEQGYMNNLTDKVWIYYVTWKSWWDQYRAWSNPYRTKVWSYGFRELDQEENDKYCQDLGFDEAALPNLWGHMYNIVCISKVWSKTTFKLNSLLVSACRTNKSLTEEKDNFYKNAKWFWTFTFDSLWIATRKNCVIPKEYSVYWNIRILWRLGDEDDWDITRGIGNYTGIDYIWVQKSWKELDFINDYNFSTKKYRWNLKFLNNMWTMDYWKYNNLHWFRLVMSNENPNSIKNRLPKMISKYWAVSKPVKYVIRNENNIWYKVFKEDVGYKEVFEWCLENYSKDTTYSSYDNRKWVIYCQKWEFAWANERWTFTVWKSEWIDEDISAATVPRKDYDSVSCSKCPEWTYNGDGVWVFCNIPKWSVGLWSHKGGTETIDGVTRTIEDRGWQSDWEAKCSNRFWDLEWRIMVKNTDNENSCDKCPNWTEKWDWVWVFCKLKSWEVWSWYHKGWKENRNWVIGTVESRGLQNDWKAKCSNRFWGLKWEIKKSDSTNTTTTKTVYYNAWCLDGKIASNKWKAVKQSVNVCGSGWKQYKDWEEYKRYASYSDWDKFKIYTCVSKEKDYWNEACK